MNLLEAVNLFSYEKIVAPDEDREISGIYAGDLLSWVIGRAKEDDIWFTVMGNVNAIAVASLADCTAIVLTEGSLLDDDAKEKAISAGINVYKTDKTTAAAVIELGKHLGI